MGWERRYHLEQQRNWTTTGTTLPPVSGDSLVFGVAGTSGVDLNNNLTSGTFSVNGITFNPGAAAFVIGNGTTTVNAGNSFVLTGSIANNSANLETINDPFTLTGTQTFSTAGSGNLALSGIVGGSGGLIASGNGELVLSALSTFTGNVLVSSGTLNAAGTGGGVQSPAYSPLGNPQVAGRLITVGSGATLQFSGGNVLGGGQSVVPMGSDSSKEARLSTRRRPGQQQHPRAADA